ncbi:MAG: hypothetical protein KF678_08405 [Phycisphaeraceae bacterium]|nr:hypothetical protein [Phycisphaeraceae bacterium]
MYAPDPAGERTAISRKRASPFIVPSPKFRSTVSNPRVNDAFSNWSGAPICVPATGSFQSVKMKSAEPLIRLPF